MMRGELVSLVANLENRYDRLVQAVKTVYYAAHWSADRDCGDQDKMWEELRDAAGLPKGKAPKQILQKDTPAPEREKAKLYSDVPPTLEDAINKLYDKLSPKDITYIRQNGTQGGHFFLGMQIRNQWGLWHDSPLAQHFKKRFGLGHADDMSGMILKGLECMVNGESYDSEKDAEYYRDYWRQQGIDPLTQKELK